MKSGTAIQSRLRKTRILKIYTNISQRKSKNFTRNEKKKKTNFSSFSRVFLSFRFGDGLCVFRFSYCSRNLWTHFNNNNQKEVTFWIRDKFTHTVPNQQDRFMCLVFFYWNRFRKWNIASGLLLEISVHLSNVIFRSDGNGRCRY